MASCPEPWVTFPGVARSTGYSARALAPWGWHAVCLALALASGAGARAVAGWLVPFPLALTFALWTSFAVRRVAVTDEHLVVHHGWFGAGLPLHVVRGASIVSRATWRWLGLWWQAESGGDVVWDLGGERHRAVRVVYSHGGVERAVVLHVPDADGLAAALARRAAGGERAPPGQDAFP